ncbi:MAG: amidohydrolase family protein [Acidobacteriota bacterium]
MRAGVENPSDMQGDAVGQPTMACRQTRGVGYDEDDLRREIEKAMLARTSQRLAAARAPWRAMTALRSTQFAVLAVLALVLAGCQAGVAPSPDEAPSGPRLEAFIGGRIIDGSGADPIEEAVMVVRDGRIEAIGPAGSIEIPAEAERVDLSGSTLIPGLINAHGHVGDTLGLEGGHYSEANILRQLSLYARYGITTVNSLGGDGAEAIEVRDRQETPDLDRARLYVAGPVVTGNTPEEARALVDDNADRLVDFIKIRVDDNLGTTAKMSPQVYRAVIDEAHRKGLQVASHLFYLDDAKELLRAGVDFVAHSVRDRLVDDELISLLKENGVCYCPTLMREVSTFVYEDVPDFFDDPFFLKEADPGVLEQLEDPGRMRRIRESPSAQRYKQALQIASQNLEILADAGVKIAMGTDTGPPRRFQGYFEHLELELMVKAGLDPALVLNSATGDAAACLGLPDVGTLAADKWADFIVLGGDPLAEITNTRSIQSVWIAGNRVPDRRP